LFRVNPEDGSLRNTDGLFEIDALGEDGPAKFLAMGKTFQGGNWNHLQAMLDIEAGEEILYVGDHLYADVLRSKRALGWRSCFIMPELPEEMRIFHQQMELWSSIMELRKLRDELIYHADGLRKEQESFGSNDGMKMLLRFAEDEILLKNKLTEAHKEYHSAFHSRWGQMVSNLLLKFNLFVFKCRLFHIIRFQVCGRLSRFSIWILCQELCVPVHE
jgi:hypothetical protein